MTYLAPQSLAIKMSDSLAAQLDQIKEINGDKFFRGSATKSRLQLTRR